MYLVINLDLKPQLGDFIMHNYVSQWQEKEFRNYLQHIHEDIVVSCADYFDNYVFMVQNEIQGMHGFKF